MDSMVHTQSIDGPFLILFDGIEYRETKGDIHTR